MESMHVWDFCIVYHILLGIPVSGVIHIEFFWLKGYFVDCRVSQTVGSVGLSTSFRIWLEARAGRDDPVV